MPVMRKLPVVLFCRPARACRRMAKHLTFAAIPPPQGRGVSRSSRNVGGGRRWTRQRAGFLSGFAAPEGAGFMDCGAAACLHRSSGLFESVQSNSCWPARAICRRGSASVAARVRFEAVDDLADGGGYLQLFGQNAFGIHGSSQAA